MKTKPSIEVIQNKVKMFKDVKYSDWFKETIDKASSNGIVMGYTDGSFKPNNPMTRAEMASILTEFNGWDGSLIENNIEKFPDVNENDWFYLPVMISKSMGVIKGYPEGVFKPQNYVSRAEAFALIATYIESINNSDTPGGKDTIEQPKEDKPAAKTEDNPPKVSDSKLVLTSKGTDFVNIRWNKANDDITEAENLEYAVYYSEKNNISKLDDILKNGIMAGNYEKDVNSKKITGLKDNTTYYFNVVVKDGKDNKTAYECIEVKTNTYGKDDSSKSTGSKTESKQPSITIDVSKFKPLNKENTIFYIDEKVDKLTGTAKNIVSMEIIIKSGQLVLGKKYIESPDNWSLDTPGLIVGNNSITINATGSDGKTLTKKLILINDSEENIKSLQLDTDDSDGDNLLNWEENVFGTDKNKSDTDEDGLTDYEEIHYTFTDPLVMDTDGNGIGDGEEDFDLDGLNNMEECQYGTDPYKSDTDRDGLTDYEEIFIYLTIPLLKDSDNDALSDGLEPEYGMDPNNPHTLNDGILDGDRVFKITKTSDAWNEGDPVKPMLEIELKGKQIETLSIEKVDENDLFLNTDIPGYIGNAYDFNVDGEFSSATLTFEFDEKLLGNPDFVPAIYYWNEDEQILFELPNQTVSGNTVSAPITHFSKYMVIAKNSYNEELFKFEILPPTDKEMQNTKYDLALILDRSGSISKSNFDLMKSLSNRLVQSLSDEDRIAVFTFTQSVTRDSGFVDKNTAASVISALPYPSGNTAIYDAINMANNEFITNSSSDASKVIIVLTDGKDNSSRSSSSYVTQTAVDNKIVIYTVGVGSVNTAVLTNIAQSTGGGYYSASNFSQLEGIFDRLQVDIDLYKDSDSDGISDYHEKKIASGQLRLGNGVPITNFASLNYLNPDSDGDGIPDGQELIIKSQYVKDTDIYYCYLFSNPCKIDSDGDKLLDNEDPTPLVKHDSRFERIYDPKHRPVNEHIISLQEESDKVYNTEKPGLNDYWIYQKASLTVEGGAIAQMPQASAALLYFLLNIGKTYTINAKKLINDSPNAKNHFYDNINQMLAASEDMVMDGKTMVITTNTPFVATTLSNVGSDKWKEMDWWYTIGNSSAAMTGTVTCSGEEYTMELNYFIDDFYDWEKGSPLKGGPLVTDGEMYRLHEVGLAKQFPVEGSYKVKVTWTKGQRFNTSTNKPKVEEVRR